MKQPVLRVAGAMGNLIYLFVYVCIYSFYVIDCFVCLIVCLLLDRQVGFSIEATLRWLLPHSLTASIVRVTVLTDESSPILNLQQI